MESNVLIYTSLLNIPYPHGVHRSGVRATSATGNNPIDSGKPPNGVSIDGVSIDPAVLKWREEIIFDRSEEDADE